MDEDEKSEPRRFGWTGILFVLFKALVIGFLLIGIVFELTGASPDPWKIIGAITVIFATLIFVTIALISSDLHSRLLASNWFKPTLFAVIFLCILIQIYVSCRGY
jgi:hypothetical protein